MYRSDICGGLIWGKVIEAIGQTEQGNLLLVEFEKSRVKVLPESVFGSWFA